MRRKCSFIYFTCCSNKRILEPMVRGLFSLFQWRKSWGTLFSRGRYFGSVDNGPRCAAWVIFWFPLQMQLQCFAFHFNGPIGHKAFCERFQDAIFRSSDKHLTQRVILILTKLRIFNLACCQVQAWEVKWRVLDFGERVFTLYSLYMTPLKHCFRWKDLWGVWCHFREHSCCARMARQTRAASRSSEGKEAKDAPRPAFRWVRCFSKACHFLW